jgi:gliding motility-associated-like protein
VNFTNATTTPGTCTWDFGDGSSGVSGDCNPSYTYTEEGCFDVTLGYLTLEGCKVDTTLVNYVCTSAPPVADFTMNPNPTTITNTLVNFTNQSSANSSSFNWVFGDGFGTSTDVNPTYVYPNTQPGSYEVCLTAATNAGCEHTTCQIVVVNDEFLIYVPNAFTPDGDGLNDVFMPVINGYEVESFKMYIFNRWGEMIFETSFPNVGWDGTYLGNPPKQDVYVWRIEVKDAVSGEKKQFHGHVTLLADQDGN